MSESNNTIQGTVKTIKIGEDQRYISAKYDIDGNEIVDHYAKADDVNQEFNNINKNIEEVNATINTNCVKNDDLENKVSDTINKLITNGTLEVNAAVQKYITYENYTNSLSLSSQDQSGRIIKIIIFNCTPEDEDSVNITFDATEAKTLTSSFIREGAFYEIYEKLAICHDTNGNVQLFVSPYNS